MERLIKNPKKEGKYLAHCSDGKAYSATKVNKYMPGGVMFFVIPANVQVLGYTRVNENGASKATSTKKKK